MLFQKIQNDNPRASATWQGKIELLRQMKQDAIEKGVVPYGDGFVKLDPDAEIFQAIIRGEPVSFDGVDVKTQAKPPLSELPMMAKLGILVGIVLLVFIVLFLINNIGKDASSKTTPTPTISKASSTPTYTYVSGKSTPSTLIDYPNATAQAKVNAPVSLEIAEITYVLGIGKVNNAGEWNPLDAEWLESTKIRRVVAIPWNTDSVSLVDSLSPNTPIRLRLSGGVVESYSIADIKRVKRSEVEYFSVWKPSLLIVLYGERSAERTVIVCDAVQETASSTPAPKISETPSSQKRPGTSQIVVSGNVIATTNVSLEVLSCVRQDKIGSMLPPTKKQQYMTCSFKLKAKEKAPYSGSAIAITEYKNISNTLSWWPKQISVAGTLGDGTLGEGEQISAQVVGVVNTGSANLLNPSESDPVMVWEQDGTWYIVHLEQKENSGDTEITTTPTPKK
ncbi:MAG: hypothetical protein AB9888_00170 [Bacteroidales bacterium]